MKIAITFTEREIFGVNRALSKLGLPKIEPKAAIQGYGPMVSETKVKSDGSVKFTNKLDEQFTLDVYGVLENHAPAISGVITMAKGLWSTCVSLSRNLTKDLKAVAEKYMGEKKE